MSKFEIGYRILISKYGYYGSIGRPYVIYSIKTLDLLKQKEGKIEQFSQQLPEIVCDGSDSGIIDKLEHLIIQVHNFTSKVELKCLHPFVNLSKLRRMDHDESIVLPIINRVVTDKVVDHIINLLNEDSAEILPQNLIDEVRERIPDQIIVNLLKILRIKGIPYYDTEDDSRLLALGEGKSSIVISKKLDKNFIKFLIYPYRSLDIDEIDNNSWKKYDFKKYLKEENLDLLSKNLEKDWLEFKNLIAHGSIPKFLVTGTNGKTSTTRILAYILRSTLNKVIGLTSTSGIFVDGIEPEYGDFTGPWSARNALLKPIDIGVFEVARGGLIREGVIFDTVESAIITNVAEDHIGLRGIDSVEKMLKVKSLVYHAATKSVVLYADDPQLYRLYLDIKKYQFKLKVDTSVWGVSSDKEKLLEFDHGILLEEDEILLMLKDFKQIQWKRIGSLKELLVSNYGIISFLNINATLALAASISVGIDPSKAFQSLKGMNSDIENNPGRGNLFEKNNRWFMLDYGHNPHALKQIKITIENIKSVHKINKVIFLALTAGDRREEDFIEYGRLLSSFPIDEVIFKDMWVDRRGREEGEVGEFIENVMRKEGFAGDIFQKPNPEEAINFTISRSNENDLVYLCAEKSEIMMKLISEYNFES